jgi:hypothetical protein
MFRQATSSAEKGGCYDKTESGQLSDPCVQVAVYLWVVGETAMKLISKARSLWQYSLQLFESSFLHQADEAQSCDKQGNQADVQENQCGNNQAFVCVVALQRKDYRTSRQTHYGTHQHLRCDELRQFGKSDSLRTK